MNTKNLWFYFLATMFVFELFVLYINAQSPEMQVKEYILHTFLALCCYIAVTRELITAHNEKEK
jgi:Na+-translocating ferredoxin:NAD+ oxidoreductase RnfA subunit